MRMVSPEIDIYKLAQPMGSWLHTLVNVFPKAIHFLSDSGRKEFGHPVLDYCGNRAIQHHLLDRARRPG